MAPAPRDLEVIDEMMAKVLRDKTEAERLAIANALWVYARDMLRAVLRQEHPDWTDEEARRKSAGDCRMEPSELLA